MARFRSFVSYALVISICILSVIAIGLRTDWTKQRIARYLEAYSQRVYGLRIQIGKLDYRLFPLQLHFGDFRVLGGKQDQEVFLTTPGVHLELAYSVLWSDSIRIRKLTINTPSVDPHHLPHPKIRDQRLYVDQLTITGGALSAMQVKNIRLDAKGGPVLEIRRLSAEIHGAQFEATGKAGFQQNVFCDLNYSIKGNAASLAPIFPAFPPMEGKFITHGSMSARVGRISAIGEAQLPALSIQGSGRFPVSANYKWDSSSPSPITLRVQWKSLPVSILRKYATRLPSIQSVSDGSLYYTGKSDFWKGKGWLRTNLTPIKKRSNSPYGTINAKLQDARIDFENTRIGIAGSTASITGTMQPSRLDLDVNAHLNIRGVSGTVAANLQASGKWIDWPDSNAVLAIKDGALTKNGLDFRIKKDSRLQFANRKIDVDLNAGVPHGAVHITGAIDITRTPYLNIRARGSTDLALISVFTTRVQGEGPLSADFHIHGKLSRPTYEGELLSDAFRLYYPDRRLTLDRAQGRLKADPDLISIRTAGLLNGAEMKFEGSLPRKNNRGELHLSVASFPMSYFLPHADVDGILNIKADATGSGNKLIQWNGEAVMSPSALRVRGKNIELNEPLHLHLTSGVLKTGIIHLRAADTLDFTGTATADFRDGSVDAQLQGSMDLALLSNVIPESSISGKFFAQLQVNGTLLEPHFGGSVQVTNGAFLSSHFPLAVEQIQLKAPLKTEGADILQFTAHAGGGSIHGTGRIRFDGWDIAQTEISTRLRNIGLIYPEGLRSELDGDIRFTKIGQSSKLSGDVLIRRAVFTRNVDDKLRTIVTNFADKSVLSEQRQESGGPELDLRVHNIQPLVVSNNLGDVLTSLNLQITGTRQKPNIAGEIKVLSGSQLYLQTRIFKVEKGWIHFRPQKNIPELDLLLSSVILDDETKQSYQVRLPIQGPMDDLKELDPVSSPALLPAQVYFLLLTGRTEAQLTHAEAKFMRGQLLTYYSGRKLLPVPEKIGTNPVLNRFDAKPEFISSERDPGARVVAGKDYFAGISMIYSLPLAPSSERTWIANYKWKPNLAFRFTDREDGSYTSGIHHILRFGQKAAVPQYSKVDRHPPTIGKIQLINDSSIQGIEIDQALAVHQGDTYDAMQVQAGIAHLKQLLQAYGYLYPRIQMETAKIGPNSVALQIIIRSGGLRRMTFIGIEPQPKQLETYNEWLREAFSDDAVVGMIQQDLLLTLWSRGYHDAHVAYKIDEAAGVYAFEAKPGRQSSRVDLRFSGLQKMDATKLADNIGGVYQSEQEMLTEVLHSFSLFTQKLESVGAGLGFPKMKVLRARTQMLDGKVIKEIFIDEGRPVHIADVVVSDHQQFPEELQKQLKLTRGAIFDSSDLAEDELTIHRYYEDRGYSDFRMKSKITGSSDAILFYDMYTGGKSTIDSILISGNYRTKKEVIQKQLPFKVGDLLVQAELAEAQKNLSDLKLFQNIEVSAHRAPATNHYDVRIKLEESPRYELTSGIGYNSEKKLEGQLQLSDLNLFGTGRALSLIARANSEDRILRLVYHTPTPHGLHWKTLISSSYEQLEQPLLFTETVDIQFQRQRRLNGPFVAIGNYRLERVEVTERDPTETYFLGEDPVILSRLSAILLADTRDDLLNPQEGTFGSLEISYAPSFLGSQSVFSRAFSQLYHYRSFGKIVWASGLRAGFAAPRDDLIATQRFFAGGSFTLRGFEKDAVGPKDPVWGRSMGGEALFIINQELRFPIPVHPRIHGVVFYDAGNVYATTADFRLTDLRHSVGLGFRFHTPVGIGRLDWGWNLNRRPNERKSVLHFALGQAF